MAILGNDELVRCLEVDLSREGIDLLDFFRGKMSLRKLMLHIKYLSPESLVVKKSIGKQADWDLKEYMLADIIDLMRIEIWMQQQKNSKSKIKPPKPVPRPVDQSTKKKALRKVTASDIKGLLSMK